MFRFVTDVQYVVILATVAPAIFPAMYVVPRDAAIPIRFIPAEAVCAAAEPAINVELYTIYVARTPA
jgi:hypothetical protein